jgi:hypothetical protein
MSTEPETHQDLTTTPSPNTSSEPQDNPAVHTQTPTPIEDMEQFEKSIRDWVTFDNEITAHNNHVKELKKRKTSLTPSLCNFMERQRCQESHVQLSDGRLSYAIERTQTSMSQKFIQEGLVSYFRNVHNNEHAEQIAAECLEHIKSLRKTESKATLKRVFASQQN